jgi:hypothetical protein
MLRVSGKDDHYVIKNINKMHAGPRRIEKWNNGMPGQKD